MSIVRPLAVIDKLQKLYESGTGKGFSTGWSNLDKHFTVHPGRFTVVTGMPSHGKSEWLDALLVNLAMKHDFLTAVFSPENYPLELHISKMIEKYIGRPFFDGVTPRMDNNDVVDGIEWLQTHFGFISPPENQFTPMDIVNYAGEFIENVMFSRPKAIVIDPWNEMDHYRPANLSETEYISRTLTELRRFARDYDCHVFLVAHPQKLIKENGNYPVPTPYQISGSAHWYNKSDNCIAIWRDVMNNSNDIEVHVQKVRFRSDGYPGVIDLTFDPATRRIHEPNKPSALNRHYVPGVD